MTSDQRVYLLDPKWTPTLKRDDGPLNCHHADRHSGAYHRIAASEIYFQSGTEA